MIVITIIFSILFIAYLVVMRVTHGKLHSISAGYYVLREDGRDEWLFHSMMMIMAAYLFGVAIFTESWLFVVSTAGCILVSAAAHYKQKVTDLIHYGGSVMIMGGAAVGCFIAFDNWWVMGGIALGALLNFALWKWKVITNPVYWAEIVATVLIILGTVL